jgi:hypothetical protein
MQMFVYLSCPSLIKFNHQILKKMKIKALMNPAIAVMLLAVLFSCKKDDKYTLENKEVTGSMVYVTQSSVPVEFDQNGIPITLQISMEGSGTVSDIGELHMVTTFKFSLLTMQGWDFQNTYTGTDPADTFTATGASKLDQNLSGYMLELLENGTGKFKNIIGNGKSLIQIAPDQSGGTGNVNWTITY